MLLYRHHLSVEQQVLNTSTTRANETHKANLVNMESICIVRSYRYSNKTYNISTWFHVPSFHWASHSFQPSNGKEMLLEFIPWRFFFINRRHLSQHLFFFLFHLPIPRLSEKVNLFHHLVSNVPIFPQRNLTDDRLFMAASNQHSLAGCLSVHV